MHEYVWQTLLKLVQPMQHMSMLFIFVFKASLGKDECDKFVKEITIHIEIENTFYSVMFKPVTQSSRI